MNALLKNGIILIGLIALGGLGYYLFVLEREPISVDTGSTSGGQLATDEFVRSLNELRSIELDDSIFVDPRFRSFIEHTTPIPEQPVGRANPFAPVN